jgi:hypothetical protein
MIRLPTKVEGIVLLVFLLAAAVLKLSHYEPDVHTQVVQQHSSVTSCETRPDGTNGCLWV